MTKKLTLTIGSGDYDHMRDVFNGVVRAGPIEVIHVKAQPLQIFDRMSTGLEFDAAEMSMGRYVALRSQGSKPLDDGRTQVYLGDVAELVNASEAVFDAILLDIDNGPEGLTHNDNQWLYSMKGLQALKKALSPEGTLAVWSAGPDPQFVTRLKKAGLHTSVRSVRARPGKGSHHTIFLAKKGSVMGHRTNG